MIEPTLSLFLAICVPCKGMVNEEIHFQGGFWLIFPITGTVARMLELDCEEVAGKEQRSQSEVCKVTHSYVT